MPKQPEAINELVYDWVAWLRTRRFYAPPMPPNMLLLLMEGRASGEVPNARNHPLCAAFNLVINEAEAAERLPFLYVYLPEYRPKPVKSLAAELGIDRDTIYQRARTAAVKFYAQARRLEEMHTMIRREVEDYVD